MKKLLITVLLVLGLTIIGRPMTQGQHKGEDFFIVDYSGVEDLGGFWYKNGELTGFATMTKEKAEKMHKQWRLQQRQPKTKI